MPGPSELDGSLAAGRLTVVADLYYICQLERAGVFDVVAALRAALFAGRLRISEETAVENLQKFDGDGVLADSTAQRTAACTRIFGPHGNGGAGRDADNPFSHLFAAYAAEAARFRPRLTVPADEAADLAAAQAAACAVREHLLALVDDPTAQLVRQTLPSINSAFRILADFDIQQQYGADSPWDLVDRVSRLDLGRPGAAAGQRRLAASGRTLIRWLAQPALFGDDGVTARAAFRDVADEAEGWLGSVTQ